MKSIAFRNVTKKYSDKVVFSNLTIDFPMTGFVSIAGPSGIGKTTLLNLILGLAKADSGEVLINGKVSAVFQEDRLLPWESVLGNVLLPLDSAEYKNASETYRERAVNILAELGLDAELDSFPSELSGGMARRVSIARALMVDADIYIMDEPTRGLDDSTRRTVLETIHKYTDLSKDQAGNPLNKLLIIVTHNPDEISGSFSITL